MSGAGDLHSFFSCMQPNSTFESVFLAAYASDATSPFTRRDLNSLLETSRRNNATISLTGLLLHAGGNFLQAIEGPEAVVRKTLMRIESDPRHRNMQILYFDHTPERLFPDCSMGFEEVRGLSEQTHPGLAIFMQRDGLHRRSDHGVMELLRSFRGISTQR